MTYNSLIRQKGITFKIMPKRGLCLNVAQMGFYGLDKGVTNFQKLFSQVLHLQYNHIHLTKLQLLELFCVHSVYFLNQKLLTPFVTFNNSQDVCKNALNAYI